MCALQQLIAWLESWCHGLWSWAIDQKDSDSSVWAIAFTMNTWAGSLDRARFQLHGRIRKAIDASRAEAQQAHFVENMMNWEENNYDPKRLMECIRDYTHYLSILEKYERRYPTLQESEENGLSISWFPRFVLVSCACISLACLLLKRFYNGTLFVLLPYPCFCIYYKYKEVSLKRKIHHLFAYLKKKYPEMARNPEEAQLVKSKLAALVAERVKQ